VDDRRDLRLDGENSDGAHLLPGESRMSPNRDEAVHWVAVYSELAEFLRSEVQPIYDPLAGREWPPSDSTSHRGLWVANQLCNLVQLRRFDSDTVVRLHMAA
jgi:hypothetical protein